MPQSRHTNEPQSKARTSRRSTKKGIICFSADENTWQSIIDDLHEARLLGNWTLHDGLEFTPEEVADVAELIEEAAHILYVEPAKMKTMRNARKARRDARPQPHVEN